MPRLAPKRSARLERFIREHPVCCYCGVNPTETIDHLPSRQMFDEKHRPKGLEMPACDSCNQRTKGDEQVAALLGRLSLHRGSRNQFLEFRKLLLKVRKHRPLLYAELAPTWRQQYDARRVIGDTGGALNVGGPLVDQSLRTFSTKLALGLYYATRGSPLPPTGAVFAYQYTNWHRITNTLPEEIFTGLSEPQTLSQGKFEVSDQFSYQHGVIDGFGLFVATFRRAFLVHAVVHERSEKLRALLPSSTPLQGSRFRDL